MFSWFLQWNKFGNRSIFDEVKAYETKSASFLGHRVYFVRIFGFSHFISVVVPIEYTSNTAAWFYAQLNDVTPPHSCMTPYVSTVLLTLMSSTLATSVTHHACERANISCRQQQTCDKQRKPTNQPALPWWRRRWWCEWKMFESSSSMPFHSLWISK